jgi:hypothetical protein
MVNWGLRPSKPQQPALRILASGHFESLSVREYEKLCQWTLREPQCPGMSIFRYHLNLGAEALEAQQSMLRILASGHFESLSVRE